MTIIAYQENNTVCIPAPTINISISIHTNDPLASGLKFFFETTKSISKTLHDIIKNIDDKIIINEINKLLETVTESISYQEENNTHTFRISNNNKAFSEKFKTQLKLLKINFDSINKIEQFHNVLEFLYLDAIKTRLLTIHFRLQSLHIDNQLDKGNETMEIVKNLITFFDGSVTQDVWQLLELARNHNLN